MTDYSPRKSGRRTESVGPAANPNHQKQEPSKRRFGLQILYQLLATMTMCVALIRFQLVTVVLTALACCQSTTDAFTLFPVLSHRSLPSPENLSTVLHESPDIKSEGLPSNLKRKVSAKRPTLGHVVPESTKTRGSGGSANPRLRPQGKAREAGLNNPSMLKIFGGSARGRRLDSPPIYLRPMMGKVREAVYSSLTSFGLYDFPVRHLDLFSGSGSVGLESLSRGARHCTFCDLAPECCDCIQRNVDWCNFNGDDHTTQIVNSDVLQLLRDPVSVGIPERETFGIVTICPPYEEVVYADLLEAVVNCPAVTDDTVILVEYPRELWGDLPHVINGERNTLIGIRNRKYGRTVIAMYICNPTGRFENAESRPEEFVCA